MFKGTGVKKKIESSVLFFTIGIFQKKSLQMSAVIVMIY